MSRVIAAGSAKSPRILAREIVEVLRDADRFVFHVAESLPLARAEASVKNARASAEKRAVVVVKELLERAAWSLLKAE